MDVRIDFQAVTQIFEQAKRENRQFLYEYEVYDLLSLTGAETPPRYYFFPKGRRLDDHMFSSIPGEEIVIKIVSPYIIHKSDVGGVAIVPKSAKKILSTVRRMMTEIPEKYLDIIYRNPSFAPEVYKNLSEDALTSAISRDIRGTVFCQFMPPDAEGFGNELLVSIRCTREFGMIITAGLGGTDTELYAQRLKKGQAVVAAATGMTDGETFFRLFQNTTSYMKLAGLTRGQKRMVTDEQLLECFTYFISLANYFSPLNTKAPFVIDELEINPFAFTDYLMVPLDGLCRFSLPQAYPTARPIDKIDRLLHPTSIGIMGVSATKTNVGRIILDNILGNGFFPSRIKVIHPDADRIAGIPTVPNLGCIKEKLDFLVLAVAAHQLPDLIDQVIDNDLAETVLLIPGGLGETTASEQRARDIRVKIQKARLRPDRGPVFLGGNSMGILSHPGHYDTVFTPDEKLPKQRGDYPRKSVLISQSGAFMITRMSRLAFLDPAYAFSIGNQTDLTAGDILRFVNNNQDISVVACYMEGFNPLDGLAFAKALSQAVIQGKDVIFYKAGRTPEGKTATSGHTASIAGDYMVCESCIREAGAMVADTFDTFEGLCRVAKTLKHKPIQGNRVAVISNAGFESVGFADNILGEDHELRMAIFTEETQRKLTLIMKKNRIDGLVDVKNPMDVTPMSTEDGYEAYLRAIFEDPNVDAVLAGLVPLAPLMQTLPDPTDPKAYLTADTSIPRRLSRIIADYNKPLIMVHDGGSLFDPLVEAVNQEGITVFRSSDRAMQMAGRYIQGRLNAKRIAAKKGITLD